MLASNLEVLADLTGLKDTLKESLRTHFELEDNHQINIEIDEPPADTNTIIVKFNIKNDHYKKIYGKLTGGVAQITELLNDEIQKLDPNIEITNVKGPKLTEIPSGRMIHS